MKEAKISVTFLLLTVTFCVCLIVSNLMEIKTVDLGPLTITAGVIVFPLSYILNDCIVEVYGFSKARLVIWLGFGMNLLVSLLLQLGIWLPAHPRGTGRRPWSWCSGPCRGYSPPVSRHSFAARWSTPTSCRG